MQLQSGSSGREQLTRPPVAQPTHFHVEEDGEFTRISWRWLTNRQIAIHIAVFSLASALNGFLMKDAWLSMDRPTLLLALLFMVPGVYSAMAFFVNRTRITVSRSELTIHHGPVPWLGRRTLSGREFSQLYVQETSIDDTTIYPLFAIDREGNKVELLSRLKDKDQALYLEQALERQLGIEDSPVDGEVATRTHAG
jgi:hypothetical protein